MLHYAMQPKYTDCKPIAASLPMSYNQLGYTCRSESNLCGYVNGSGLRERIYLPIGAVKKFDWMHHFHRQVMLPNTELELQDTPRIARSDNFSVHFGNMRHLRSSICADISGWVML